jgi:hypothetical protein
MRDMRDKRGLSRANATPPSTCLQVVKFGILVVLVTSLCFFILISNDFIPKHHIDSSISTATVNPKDILEARLSQIADAHNEDLVKLSTTIPPLFISSSTTVIKNTNGYNKGNDNTKIVSPTITTQPLFPRHTRSAGEKDPKDPSTAAGKTSIYANGDSMRAAIEEIGNGKIVCPKLIEPKAGFFDIPPFQKKNGSTDFHFIHIPKCGGTSMTAILREVSCQMDRSRNFDCCTNPGFCDWHAFRRCNAIKGCINHFPQRPFIFKPYPSITIMREPVSRLLSAWFYRGHSPNLDFFQVRPYFKDINLGKLPKVVFEEYIDMPEYQNIQTRMLGADSFPYRNITVTDAVWCSAVEALNNIFFIGLQEAYELSVEVLLRELNVPLNIPVLKERDMSNAGITRAKLALKNNKPLMEQVRNLNHYDAKLYELGVIRFCKTVKKYPDLWDKLVKNHPLIKCPE